MTAPRVLHFSDTLLGKTETFVEARLHDDRYRSVAVTWQHVRDGLPIPCPYVVIDRHEPRGRNDGLMRLVFGPRRVLARNWAVLRVLLAARPDVVHAHFGTVGSTVAPFCRALGLPLVVSFYGFDLAAPAHDAKLAERYRLMFRVASAFTAEGPVLAEHLARIGAPRDRVRLLPLAMPSWAMATPSPRAPRVSRVLRLLQVARFVEKKGIDLSLAAVAGARARGADVRLTLAGGGPLETALRRQVADLAIEDAVQFIGYVSHDALPSLLATSDALIQPSRVAASGDTEGGYPNILVESLAQGVPVVGTRHADLPFVVRDGDNGLLCAENDVAALTDLVHRLATEPQLFEKLARRARPSVLRRHDPIVLLRLKERIYREAQRRAHATQLPWKGLPLPDPFAQVAR
ncbi:MAG TPA: glycosyltransferase [Polyangia bacterium]|nr:glycosyltransferase [Polyangia bacterium]